MDKKKSIVSYALAAVAGICFVQGLAILTAEGRLQNESV